jgi:uncharacterized DUF497 family protein
MRVRLVTRKAAADEDKHGVTFEPPWPSSSIPSRCMARDLAHSALETRRLRLGRAADGRVLLVASTLRRGNDDAEKVCLISGRRTARRIDFSDIPEASADEFGGMRRVGRPPLGDAPRHLIAIRVDPGVLVQFRKGARRRHVGYQTLFNEVLAQHVRKDVA